MAHLSGCELSKTNNLPDDLLLAGCRGAREENQAPVRVSIRQMPAGRRAGGEWMPRHLASVKRFAAGNLPLAISSSSSSSLNRCRKIGAGVDSLEDALSRTENEPVGD